MVTTLHTVLSEPNEEQAQVMEELVARSDALVVMTERGRRILRDTYNMPESKVEVMPHGIRIWWT